MKTNNMEGKIPKDNIVKDNTINKVMNYKKLSINIPIEIYEEKIEKIKNVTGLNATQIILQALEDEKIVILEDGRFIAQTVCSIFSQLQKGTFPNESVISLQKQIDDFISATLSIRNPGIERILYDDSEKC